MPLDQPLLEEDNEKEMSFLEHLEELRWHLIRSVIALMVFTIGAFIYIKEIYATVILGPSKPSFWTYRMLCKLAAWANQPGLCVDKIDFTLQSREMSGQFTMAMLSAFIVGLLFTFPYIFWEIWRFVSPGLREGERKAARGAVFYVSLLFFSGVLFGYYIVSPLAINFLANFKLDSAITNEFDITSYIEVLSMLTLATGVTFQLPIVVFMLSKVGIVTPAFMKKYRKHGYLIIVVIAGIITPSPDVYSQVLVSIPLIILYEISIGVSRRVEQVRIKAQLEFDEGI
jgi:sec-independent protein translocase protein TatC